MSSTYNMRPRAAEVLIAGGRARLIRRRETFEDLVRTGAARRTSAAQLAGVYARRSRRRKLDREMPLPID